MSADTNYATPEPAANVIPLPSPLPHSTTPSPQLENVVDMPGYSDEYMKVWTDRYNNITTCLHNVYLLYKLLEISIFPSNNIGALIFCLWCYISFICDIKICKYNNSCLL